MGYVEQHLRPGEQVVIQARRHWLPTIVVLAISLPPLALLSIGYLLSDYKILLGCCSLWSVAVVVGTVDEITYYLNTEFALTNDRIIAQTGGVIRRRSLELDVSEVKSIKLSQAPVGRLVDYGSVKLTADEVGTVTFANLTGYGQIKAQITARLPDKVT